MDSTVEHIWLVKADDETRIQRVIQRNNTTRQDVEARIATQYDPPIDHRTHIITNNNNDAILLQIMTLLNNILT